MVIFPPLENYNGEGQELEQEQQIAYSKLFAGGFEMHYVPGTGAGDYTAYKEPYVRSLAEKLRVCLEGNHASFVKQPEDPSFLAYRDELE